MGLIYYISIALVTFVLMEGFTWCLHRFVMHGFLWGLHRDHHQKQPGFFERNDLFFLIFAIPSWLCIMLGVIYKAYWVIAVGAGLSLYGACYFLVHDVIIHQRVKWFTRSNNTYIRSVRWAHKMHHKHLDKHNGESFGFLWVAKKYRDKVKKDKMVNEKHHVG